ncbi:homocysteine-responsive endoplasmic reticulum-resident ubiquitin-like domain member 2 protein [Diadema antillarum]|uniref:homocysteine-responsive endoplasmic reticulum-resident ubiquitin-like domain member 2 protein n=1 Tax=Diadema antillarum TaxID=105358 RepID=UPI003A866BC3
MQTLQNMEALAGSPFTLVVKAPNQEIGDQTVECFLDWTVRKLKKHLSTVYPTNPNEQSQRIIFSGKLLQDNLVLKDVLTVNDVKDKCTVHLVCTPSPEDQAKQEACSKRSQEAVNRTRSNWSPALLGNDGIRQRTTSSQSTSMVPPIHTLQPSLPSPHQTLLQSANSLSSSSSGPVPVPPSVMSNATVLTQAQQQVLQQIYAQQMTAYMHYINMIAAAGGVQPGWSSMSPQWGHPASHPAPTTSLYQAQPAPDQQQPVAQAPNIPQPAAAPANNAPQRMNVGGGMAMDDDNEEGARRDWLDWTFMLCRFGILLSIVYFYSSVNRFIIVAGAMFVMYLYQAGYFQLRRRNRAQPPAIQPPEPNPRAEDGHAQDGSININDDHPDESDGSTSNSDDTDGAEGTEPDDPPRPGLLATTWIFISTFFTSIVPQGPPQQIPAN